MKTKTFVLIFLTVLALKGLSADFSETNGGIYVAISGSSTNESVPFNESLAWRPFCSSTSGEAEMNYPDRSYGIKLGMFDAFGKQVPKTKLGESFGVKFDQLHNYQDVISQPKMGYSSTHIGSVLAQGPYDETAPVSGPVLPAPNELFQIEKPGDYTLEIQMQMFLIHKDTNVWTRELIRFSPIRIHVTKSSEK